MYSWLLKHKGIRDFDQKLRRAEEQNRLFDFILKANNGSNSNAQLKQDVFALIVNRFKTDGFFVEFGATDGKSLNNTFVLETQYSWKGILAEPAKMWHDELRKNRDCSLDFDCVWSVTGEQLEFDMVDKAGELSTISRFASSDRHAKARSEKTTYNVTSVSLLDLLKRHNAPSVVDYLSVDTEGSEFDILSVFPFKEYRFNCITVEHNFTKQRELIRELLEANGYRRVFDHISRWDDWYVHGALFDE